MSKTGANAHKQAASHRAAAIYADKFGPKVIETLHLCSFCEHKKRR